MTLHLTANDLFRGALCALEQAGHLINDAVALYEGGRYANSLVLGVYCREEIGRSELLVSIGKELAPGRGIAIDVLRRRCVEHTRKLREGQQGVTLPLTGQQGGKLGGLRASPASPEYRGARENVDKAVASKRRRDAPEAHERRMRALYVGPLDDGGWNRPSQETAETVFSLLDAIASDYSLRLDRLEHDDTELQAAQRAWPECPSMPAPVSPTMPRQVKH